MPLSSVPPCSNDAPGDDTLPSSRNHVGPSPLHETGPDAGAKLPPLRAVFMGTPAFAATILERLLSAPFIEVVAAYTQPDRPAGRGKKICPPPVKELAVRRHVAVEQPLHFKQNPEGDAAVATLTAYKPDVLLVAAYGLILPQRVLDIPTKMPINVHASLLPKYRGAAPIQRAIMHGETVTGITIMRMERGLDTGPILLQRAVGIDIQDNSARLHDELAVEGAELLVQALGRLAAGTLSAIAQDDARASYAPKLSKEEGLLNFSQTAATLHAQIRGVTPWPGASLRLHRLGQPDIVVGVEPGPFPLPASMAQAAALLQEQAAEDSGGPSSHARILGLADNALLLSCKDGCYAFTALRPAGRATMDARAFYNGYLAGFPDAYCSGQ